MSLRYIIRPYAITLTFLCVFTAAFTFMHLKHSNIAEAVSYAEFDPGNLMSDYVMENYSSMTEEEIQQFLTNKNSCNNANYSQYQQLSQKSGYTWHWENDHFVCLSEEKFGDGVAYGADLPAGQGESAAHIIYAAAQDYHINPQVLLVLIQKESGLLTDALPNNVNYRKATGYGCPDSAPCDVEYYGFKNQVRKAAELFRIVLDGGWTNYPIGDNYIRYSPNTSCGGSTVNVQNLATSALYRYTPYQPNDAALAAGYGTGNACSSYGNRNFYGYFSDWFGDSQAEAHQYIKNPTHVNFPDGNYYIVLNTNHDRTIQLVGPNEEQTAKIIQGVRTEDDTNIFKLQKNNDDETYSLINISSNQAIDVPTANIETGVNIQQYMINNTNAQKWYIYDNGDGTYSFSSIFDKKFAITVKDDSLVFDYYNATPEQSFCFVQTEPILADGVYDIVSNYNNDVLDVDVRNTDNVWGYDSNGTSAQRWLLNYNKQDGSYSIRSELNGKTLSADKDSISANVNVKNDVNCTGRWNIFRNEDFYEIHSACNYRLAIDYDVFNNNIQLYTSNHTAPQNWSFVLKQDKKTEGQKKLTGKYYIYSTFDPTMAFDVDMLNNKNNLWAYWANNTKAQEWALLYDEKNDAYNITSVYSGYNVDISSIKSGTSVITHPKNKNCSQLWRFISLGNDIYEIVSACNDAVAIDYFVATNRDIGIYSRNNTPAQRWRLIPIE